jgi:cell division protein FtsB
MASKLTAFILIALLLVLQGQLWFGRGSVLHVRELTNKLAVQEKNNAQVRTVNEDLQAQIKDLTEGTELVEPNEIFVKYAGQ